MRHETAVGGELRRAVRATRAHEAEAAQHGRAEHNLRLALEALDQIYLQVAENRVPRDPQQEREAHELLQKALAFYKEFAELNPADAAVGAEVVRAHRRVGDIQRLVGRYPDAERAYAAAIARAEQLSKQPAAEAAYLYELAASHNSLGELRLETGEITLANEELRQAAVLLIELVGRSPLPLYRAELARSYHGLGLVLKQQGDRSAAEEQFRQAIAVQTKLSEELPSEPRYRADLAQMHRSASRWSQGPGTKRSWAAVPWQDTTAVQHIHSAVKLLQGLVADFPDAPLYRQRLASALHDLARQVYPTPESFRQAIEIQAR